jgi:hypothetical protein
LVEYVRSFKNAVSFLISDLPDDRRARPFATVLGGLERELIAAEKESPRWLNGLRALL